MDVVCEVCGVVGYRHLLVQCNNCKNATRHRYCLDSVIYDGSSIEWLCDDCLPKHNQGLESLEWRRDDHHSIQFDSSISNKPYVNRMEMTKELWSWRRCRYRSRRARRDSIDAWTKHFLSGDALNSSEMVAGEKSKCNDVEKEGESKNEHLTYAAESANGSSHSAFDPASEIQKTMDGFEPTVNSMERLDLSKEIDSCMFSSKSIGGSIPQATVTDLLPSINDVERSHPLITEGSSPTLAFVEQADGFSHALGSTEQPHPLEVVKADGSSYSALDPVLEIEEQGKKAHLFPSVNYVEQSHPFVTDDAGPTLSSEEQVDGSNPILESWEQPHPLEVVYPLVHMPKSILGSKSPSIYSQPMQGSDMDIGIMDVLDLSNKCLDSRSMSKTVEPSSSSNGKGDSTVEKDSDERTKCLSDMEIVTPTLDNLQGSSPSIPKECLVSNVDNSDEANRSDKHLLCTVGSKEQGQWRVPSYQNISSGEVHCSCNGLNERDNSWKENGSSHPKTAPKGNRHGRSLQNDVWKTSVRAVKNVVYRQVSQMEGVNSEALPSKHVTPCKATKGSSKKRRNRPNRHSLHRTRHQKTKLIKKNRNTDPAQFSRSGRPSKQLDHTCSSVSLELFSKTKVHDANNAELRCSNAARALANVTPKKRKQLILPYSEDEDAEAMQVEDSNPRSAENVGEVKKHRRSTEDGAMNQRGSAQNCEEALHPGNSNHHVNNHKVEKKQRSIEANEDKNTLLGDPSVRCAQNDASQLASEAVVTGDHCSPSRMPVVSAPTDQQFYICTQPIDKPYWTGILKIGQEYISLAAHLSNQACKKVQELSRSLPPVMKVTMHSKLKAWPKRWEGSEPTAESIGLYFFSDSMRPNKELDRLVQYVTDHSIVLKYVVGFAKMLIFPSVLLPEKCQMFQGKHYLWGVFKRRMVMSKAGTPMKQKVCTSHIAEKKEEQQDKVKGDTLDQEMPVSKHIMPSESQPSPDAVHGVGTEADPGDQRKPGANSESPPPKLFGLVVAQTPRSEQFIRELENEGALVFAVKGLAKSGPIRL